MNTRQLWLLVLLPTIAMGQSRTEELMEQRREHQKHLSPEKNSKIEELLRKIKDEHLLERLTYGYNGISAKLGGLVTGGGFAFGPQYNRNDIMDGSIAVHASAQISTRNYQ